VKTLEIGGKLVVTDLAWSTVDASSSAAGRLPSIAAVVKEKKKDFGEETRIVAVIRNEANTHMGLAQMFEATRPTAPPAAALLARACEQKRLGRILLIEPLGPAKKYLARGQHRIAGESDKEFQARQEETVYWFCEIDGNGMPASDALAELSEVTKRLDDLMGWANAKTRLSIYTTDHRVAAGGEVVAESFATLVAGVSLAQPYVAVGKNFGNSTVLLLVAVALLIGYYGWTKYAAGNKAKLAMEMARLRAETLDKEKNAKAAESFRAETEQMVRKLQSVPSSPAPGALMDAWFKAANNVPVLLASWKLVAADCVPTLCTFSYERDAKKSPGTAADFARDAAAYGVAHNMLPGKGEVAVAMLPPVPARDIATLNPPFADRFQVEFTSLFQANDATGISFTVKPPEKAPPRTGPDNQVVQMPMARGSYVVKGSRIFEFQELAHLIDLPNVSLEKLHVDFKGLPNSDVWSMEGSYVTK
jgi:hypothetical protein